MKIYHNQHTQLLFRIQPNFQACCNHYLLKYQRKDGCYLRRLYSSCQQHILYCIRSSRVSFYQHHINATHILMGKQKYLQISNIHPLEHSFPYSGDTQYLLHLRTGNQEHESLHKYQYIQIPHYPCFSVSHYFHCI